MSLYHQELEDFKIAGATTIYMFMPLINTTNFSIGSQLKEMLKSKLCRLNTVKRLSLEKRTKSNFEKGLLNVECKNEKAVKVSSGFKRNSRKVGGWNYQKSKALCFLHLIKAR